MSIHHTSPVLLNALSSIMSQRLLNDDRSPVDRAVSAALARLTPEDVSCVAQRIYDELRSDPVALKRAVALSNRRSGVVVKRKKAAGSK